jgi:hypothetical protein
MRVKNWVLSPRSGARNFSPAGYAFFAYPRLPNAVGTHPRAKFLTRLRCDCGFK